MTRNRAQASAVSLGLLYTNISEEEADMNRLFGIVNTGHLLAAYVRGYSFGIQPTDAHFRFTCLYNETHTSHGPFGSTPDRESYRPVAPSHVPGCLKLANALRIGPPPG
jgi:hypothetical protein